MLFILWVVQCSLGSIIHFVKPKLPSRRPPHNYLHAIIGLSIIALSFYQVRLGYQTTWPTVTGRGDVGNAANIVWYIWIAVRASLTLTVYQTSIVSSSPLPPSHVAHIRYRSFSWHMSLGSRSYLNSIARKPKAAANILKEASMHLTTMR